MNSLRSNTTGRYNTCMGVDSLFSVSNGENNTAIGYLAGTSITSGTNNVAIGYWSLQTNNIGMNNVAVGANALYANTASNNTALGHDALLLNSTSTGLTAVGYQVLRNSTGNNNTAIGFQAGLNITTGSENTIIGEGTGLGITTGSKNTIVGANITGLSSSLSNNIILADGDGNIRFQVDDTGSTSLKGNKLTNFVPTINSGGALTITSANQDQYCGTVYQVTGAVNISVDSTVRDGFSISVIQVDANQCTFVAGSGLTLFNRSGHTKSAGQWATCTLIKNGSNLILAGDTV